MLPECYLITINHHVCYNKKVTFLPFVENTYHKAFNFKNKYFQLPHNQALRKSVL
jgi:hypothetical protein